MSERVLEKLGLLKHRLTTKEISNGEIRLRELTTDYLEGRVDLETYQDETDKLPNLDLRRLAHKLNFEG